MIYNEDEEWRFSISSLAVKMRRVILVLIYMKKAQKKQRQILFSNFVIDNVILNLPKGKEITSVF